MTPSNAILLSLVLPGSSHFVLGKPVRGLVALVVTLGAFFAGYAIVGDRLFIGVLVEPFSFLEPVFNKVPLMLLPEVLNLGCASFAAITRDLPTNPAGLNEALRLVRLPLEGEHLGFFLTSSSGILSALFAADAMGLALGQKAGRCNRAFAAGISWLLPGSGHYLAGQKDKAYLMGGAVLLMFLMGLYFSDFCAIDRGHHNAYWIPQTLFGGGILASALGLGALEIPDPLPLRYSLGYTLTAIAGLMNLVIMVDSYTVIDEQVTGAAASEVVAA